MSQFEESSTDECRYSQEAVERLSSNKQRWASMSPVGRLECLHQILVRLQNLDHEGWGLEAAKA